MTLIVISRAELVGLSDRELLDELARFMLMPPAIHVDLTELLAELAARHTPFRDFWDRVELERDGW